MIPIQEAFGSDVIGLDLSAFADSPEPDTLDWLRARLADRLLLRFRGQQLTPTQVIALSAQFGHVEEGLRRERDRAENKTDKVTGRAEHFPEAPGVKVISARADYDGKPAGDRPRAELDWHADGTFLPYPCAWSVLYCRIAPEVDAPRTYWVDVQRAFASLPTQRQADLARLQILHKSQAYPTKFLPEDSPIVGDCRSIAHPVVRLLPETGRPAIFLPNDRDCPVLEDGERWNAERSRRFIQEMYALAEDNSPIVAATLEPDDLVLWDNRALVHRRDDIDPDIDRELWLTTILGEAPVVWAPELVGTGSAL